MASGRPIAFDTKGTVREARGFTSITKSSSFFTAYWTFIRPRTPSSRASFCVDSMISSITAGPSEYGGSEQALSPE